MLLVAWPTVVVRDQPPLFNYRGDILISNRSPDDATGDQRQA